MTLIATHISKYGIIHATDSNVTYETQGSSDLSISPGQKAFEVSHLTAGLTVAGSYSVGGVEMPIWMVEFLQRRAVLPVDTLGAFARALGAELEQQMTTEEKDSGSMIHLAGYSSDGVTSHPEFWFVRNVHGIDQATGGYTDIRDDFAVSEDFWSHTPPHGYAFEMDGYYLYANGFEAGRIPFLGINQYLLNFFQAVWNKSEWGLHPPASIKDVERLFCLYMSVVTTLFEISGDPAPAIGGDIQTLLISAPSNTVNYP